MILLRAIKLKCLAALLLLMWSASAMGQIGDQLGVPNLLLGRAGVAGPATAEAANINPALAAELMQSELRLDWGLGQISFQQRYPGFPTHSSKTSGFQGSPMPSFVYKPTPRIGVGGLLIPFPVKQDVNMSDVPIVVFGQQNMVNIEGTGQLKALVNAHLGFRINPRFTIGVNLQYAALGADLSLRVGQAVTPLVDIDADIKTTNIKVGMKWAVNTALSLGISTSIFSSTTTTIGVDSLFDDLLQGDNNQAVPAGQAQTAATFINPIRFGLGLRPMPRVMFLFDLEYKRVVARREFSLVDLTEKPKDVYNTLSLFSGAALRLKNNDEALFGFNYRPSEVGPGQAGVEGKSGFGFIDLVTNLGEPPSTPGWDMSFGYRFHFGEQVGSSRSRVQQMSAEVGFVYGESSIGVDNEGEQPGAYLVRRTKIPFSFTYRF